MHWLINALRRIDQEDFALLALAYFLWKTYDDSKLAEDFRIVPDKNNLAVFKRLEKLGLMMRYTSSNHPYGTYTTSLGMDTFMDWVSDLRKEIAERL